MAPWLPSLLIAATGRRAARRLEEAARDPELAQRDLLRDIVRRNAGTAFGREHGFGSIDGAQAWRRQVPVASYEDLRPYIDRMARGEPDVLVAEPVEMFARTSGTTGQPKLVPVTRTCRRRAHAPQSRAWLHRAMQDHPNLLDGKALSLVSPAVEDHTEAGIPCGSTSGAMYRGYPRAVRGTYAIPYEVFEIADYEAKYYALMRVGLGVDVSFVVTANPTSVTKLCEVADQRADDLLRDLHDGTLREDVDLPGATRALILSHCRADPARAAQLAAARERRGGRLLPADYWPNVALIGCWCGGTVGFYVDELPQWFDPDGTRPVPVRDLGWLSSELRGSVPLHDGSPAGVLTVGTSLFEFVSAEEVEFRPDASADWAFLAPHEVTAGAEYYVFVTTTGGLYRYDINDVLRVDGWFERAPLVSFVRKGRDMTSLTGEKVTVNQIVVAFQRAAKETSVSLRHFCAEAQVETARYSFLVETARDVPHALLRTLLGAIDRHLSAQNIEYDAKRRSDRLRAPELQVMRSGWYERLRRRVAGEGRPLFQHKAVVLRCRTPGQDGVADADEVVASLTG